MTSVRSIKLSYLDEIRRLPIQSLKAMTAGESWASSFESLKNIVVKTFPALEGREFSLKWTDEAKDVITVATDDELNEAFAVADMQALNVVRFDVVALTELLTAAEKPQESQANKSVHRNIVCDGCGTHPIVGDRFKCSVRADFDLCFDCEAKDTSPHAYLKIKCEDQAPAAVMTILRPNQAGSNGPSSGHNEAMRKMLQQKIAQVEAACGDKVVPLPGGFGGGRCGGGGGGGGGRCSGPRWGGPNPFGGAPSNFVGFMDELQEAFQGRGPFGGGGGGGCGAPTAAGEEMTTAAGDASVVRLECVSSVRDFGPFKLMRKPNGTAVFLKVALEASTKTKPWKNGGCLHIGRKGNVDMNGSGGPWASFHVEPCSDENSPGVPNGLVRLVCGNRKFCLASVNGRLVGVPSTQVGPHTQFRINEASASAVPPAAAAKEEDAAAKVAAAEVAAAALSADENFAKALAMNGSVANLPPVVPTARFVEDITVVDGTAMSPGQRFDKIWRVRNDGDVPFPEGCRLVHVGGECFSAPTGGVDLEPGIKQPLEEFDVAVPCVAPRAPGKYVSYWRLVTPSGAQFGHRLWIDISVTDMESKEDDAPPAAAPLAASSNLGKMPEVAAPPVPPAKTESVLDVLNGGGAAAAAAPAAIKDSTESLEADKWEQVEAPVSPPKQYSASNPFLGGDEADANSGAAAAEELSASMEGAALAGSELNAVGLTESVAAVVDASKFDEKLTKWQVAVTKITEMGFDDVGTIIALLEKHAAPENFEAKLQVIVGELLSGMPMLN